MLTLCDDAPKISGHFTKQQLTVSQIKKSDCNKINGIIVFLSDFS